MREQVNRRCKCGHPKWKHGNGRASCAKCACEGFESPQGESPNGDYEQAGREEPSGSTSESPASISTGRNLPQLLRDAERRVNAHVFKRGGDDSLASIPADLDRDVDLLLMEAALEIELLQDREARLNEHCRQLSQEHHKALDEIESLRAALKEISTDNFLYRSTQVAIKALKRTAHRLPHQAIQP